MNWIFINSKEDLTTLEESNCWEDSSVLEFYATPKNESYFPSDISRSGYRLMNIHMLIGACSPQGQILELAFIDCDQSDLHFLTQPFIRGRIDSLKRIEIENHKGATKLRCSRLIYRYCEPQDLHYSGQYYQNANDSKKSAFF